MTNQWNQKNSYNTIKHIQDYFIEKKALVIEILNQKLNYVITDIVKNDDLISYSSNDAYLEVVAPKSEQSPNLMVRYLKEKQEFEIEIDSSIPSFDDSLDIDDNYFYEHYFLLSKDLEFINYIVYLRSASHAYPQLEISSNMKTIQIRQRHNFDNYSQFFNLPIETVYDTKMSDYANHLFMLFVDNGKVLESFDGEDLIEMIHHNDDELMNETYSILSMVKI